MALRARADHRAQASEALGQARECVTYHGAVQPPQEVPQVAVAVAKRAQSSERMRDMGADVDVFAGSSANDLRVELAEAIGYDAEIECSGLSVLRIALMLRQTPGTNNNNKRGSFIPFSLLQTT